MMIIFKILAILITTLAGLIHVGLESIWHDKRTNRHKQVRSILMIFMVIGFFIASFLVVWDDQKSGNQIKTLTELKNNALNAVKISGNRELSAINDREKIKVDLNTLKKDYNQQIRKAEVREEQATHQRKQLESQIDGLQTMLEPFVTVANIRFPDQDDQKTALSKLADDLKKMGITISEQTQKIETQKEKLQEVESQVKPRSIKPELQSQLIAELSKQKGEEINITCVMGDQESLNFATELKKIFLLSGWKVDGIDIAMYTGPVKGLTLVIQNNSVAPKTKSLFLILKKLGYKIVGQINDKMETDIGIIVGAKL